MSKTTNKFAPEVHESAVRMVIDHECDYPSRWAAVVPFAEKIDCGKRAGAPAEVAVKMTALEREVCKLRQAYAV
ncbi:hypothetical protein [Sphingobium sp. CR2-8]|uniref:hypothetical protein n=1 Tax=Sphingobium sp. CR2-8 TaxID=1306534 RepID=UPI003FA3CDB3